MVLKVRMEGHRKEEECWHLRKSRKYEEVWMKSHKYVAWLNLRVMSRKNVALLVEPHKGEAYSPWNLRKIHRYGVLWMRSRKYVE